MKIIWELNYETIPDNGVQKKRYNSFAEAKKDIRKIISKIYLSPYIKAIREEESHKAYRMAIADFLDNYISRTDFINSDEVIPSDDPDDYEFERKSTIENDAGMSIDDDDWNDEDGEVDELDDFDIYIAKDSLSFECYYEGRPHLDTNMVVMDDENKEYYFEFFVDMNCQNKLKELQMKLTPLQHWGTSSYPLLILRTLDNSQVPLNQKQIISQIKTCYDNTTIERKAIGRNIELLNDLGYDIRHSASGYFIQKKPNSIDEKDLQTIVESIKANKSLDDERKQELIDKLVKL